MKSNTVIGLACVVIFVCLIIALCSGCATEHGSATPGYWAPSSPVDPAARFGVLLEATLPKPVADKGS